MTPPLTIAHFLNKIRFERGGIVRSLLDLAAVMASAGHEMVLLTFDASDVPESWRRGTAGAPRIVEIPPPFGDGLWLSRKAIRIAEENIGKADILHLHAAWGMGNVQLANHARRLGVPYVVSPHGSLSRWAMSQKTFKKRIFLGLLGRRYLENAAAVLFTAQADLEEAQTWLSKSRLANLPLIFDFESFDTLPGPQMAEKHFKLPPPDVPKILFLSRVHPTKGVDLLVESLKLLRDQGVVCELLIAGPEDAPAYLTKIKAMIDRYSLKKQARFLGLVHGKMKLSLYEAADIFVMPSHKESFGLVQIEAMACGTPVLTTKGVAIWRELQEGGAEIVDRSAPAIAQGVKQLFGNRAALGQRGEHGRSWVKQYLPKDRLLKQYEQFYAGLRSNPDEGSTIVTAPPDATS